MKKVLIFLTGLVIGVLGTSAVVALREASKKMQESDKPRVVFDEEARKIIRESCFPVSAAAYDLYYYIDGFQDKTIFIAFSDRREDLDKLVSEKTGRRIEELEAWKGQIERNSDLYEPGVDNKLFLTSLYDLDHVTDALFYQAETEGTITWHLIYDRRNNRVYYCWWNT